MCDVFKSIFWQITGILPNNFPFEFLLYNIENWPKFEVYLIALICLCCGPMLKILIKCWDQFLISLLQKILNMVKWLGY
jgi:hypothetical protein